MVMSIFNCARKSVVEFFQEQIVLFRRKYT